jgi:hypothetical protein
MLDQFLDKVAAVFEFRETLTPETDRGCALMAAAYLDARLEGLLRASFVDSSVADELLEPAKPLGSFSSRIDAAFVLGLLGASERRDLHLIRKIRNDFGHNADPITFEFPAIASRCSELTFSYHESGAGARSHFTSAVFAILATIDGGLHHATHAALRADPPISEELKKQARETALALMQTEIKPDEET